MLEYIAIESLPTWERGLKYLICMSCLFRFLVAPYMGAWIEILCSCKNERQREVAPYMGAWIEILFFRFH